MHAGKLLASWRRKVSLAVNVAHADNVLPGLAAAADAVEAASSSVGMPPLATALFTCATTSVSVLTRAAREAPIVAFARYVFHRRVGGSYVLLCFIC
jgi:hypothetical protein